jgi:hypothetical protein
MRTDRHRLLHFMHFTDITNNTKLGLWAVGDYTETTKKAKPSHWNYSPDWRKPPLIWFHSLS